MDELLPQRHVHHQRVTLIDRINSHRASSLPFSVPKWELQVPEAAIVRDVLRVLQGFSTDILPWNSVEQCFSVRNGINVSHLSQTSLYNMLKGFTNAASSLRRVEIFIQMVMREVAKSWLGTAKGRPTLEAFANVVQIRLKSLRKVALKTELEATEGKGGTYVTLLCLYSRLSRVIAGAEFLEYMVNVAVPESIRLGKKDIGAGQLATHILSTLYNLLESFCLFQDGEEDAYGTILLLFVGSLWPISEALDSWLREGLLVDPAGELFFCENQSVPIENSAFWKSGYCIREVTLSSEQNYKTVSGIEDAVNQDSSPPNKPDARPQKLATKSSPAGRNASHTLVCPNFLQPLEKAILSAGKSLQLLRHAKGHPVGDKHSAQDVHDSSDLAPPYSSVSSTPLIQFLGWKGSWESEAVTCNTDSGIPDLSHGSDSAYHEQVSLYEQLCSSVRNILGEASTEHAIEDASNSDDDSSYLAACSRQGQPTVLNLRDLLFKKKRLGLRETLGLPKENPADDSRNFEMSADGRRREQVEVNPTLSDADNKWQRDSQLDTADETGRKHVIKSFGMAFAINSKSSESHRRRQTDALNLAQYCKLSPLDDAHLQKAVFSTSVVSETHNGNDGAARAGELLENGSQKHVGVGTPSNVNDTKDVGSDVRFGRGTDFNEGPACGSLLHLHDKQTLTAIEKLLPYPTFLPPFEEHHCVSDVLPSQSKNRTVVAILEWIQDTPLKTTPPSVLVQECLTSSIQKQVDRVGRQLLAKLMGEWRLMEELALLRAIYLVGSGDLLQQFSSVLFNKLDRGEPWDDFYELNTMLQESVRSSSQGLVSPALDSLVVTVLASAAGKEDKGSRTFLSPPHIAGRAPSFGIESLDSLYFTYKVAWPLELIVDSSAIKKYNQVMLFLLKVKRAKHALDKACRWTWKNGVRDATVHQRRLLIQQKLMHFVNTLHQYVMDRVLYSAWVELCESMSSAGSLDEVIACHDAYLVSIQRQCLVAPDKLWTLISGRVNTILGLALNYYSIQRVLCDGVGAPALSARCQLEIENIERQFDECMVFLMRVLSFKLNVGHFPHLADLVTRINYNFYYMSEDGQLLSPVPESVGQPASRRPNTKRGGV